VDSAISSSATAKGAAALLIGAALVGFDGGAIGLLLPAVRADIGADPEQASWLVSLYALGSLAAIPTAGVAVRRFGGDAVFRVGAAMAVAGALMAFVSPGIAPLLGARLLQGVAQGPLLPVAAALIAVRWPPERQGRLMGAMSLAYGAAFLGGMTLTPLLLMAGWRIVFVVMGAAAVAALLAPLRPAAAPTASHAAVVSGIERSRELAAIAVLALGTGIAQVAVVFFPTLAVQRLGVTAPGAGILMLPLAVAGICATLGVTAMLDRMGAKRLVATGAVCAVAGVLLAAAAPASRTMFLVGAAVLGVGIAALSGGPLRYAAARAVGAAEQGPAQAGVALATNVGVTGGSLMLGALAARGTDERAAIEMAMIVACGVMAVLFLPTAFLGAERTRP
jgi:MFS family permease